MGKQLRQQRRGRGGAQYRSPSHRHSGAVRYPSSEATNGTILDIMHAPGRSSPVAKVAFENEQVNMIAAEGMQAGQDLTVGTSGALSSGNVMTLANVPEGTYIYNIEGRPGDGGKYVRTSGTAATVVSRGEKVVVLMPSGSFKTFDPRCRASVGVVAGGGHKDKPFVKAGKKFHAYQSKSKAYFKVRGVAMNPVDHPHGGGSHQHVGRPSTVSRNASPGRKVGRLSPQKRRRK